jgi:lysophospholipase L1-like esterase
MIIGMLAILVASTYAAESPVGMVEQPCPPPLTPPAAFNEENQRRAARDWPGLCRFRAANAAVLASHAKPRLVFMGDSITENWGLADPGFFDNAVVNRGISGQTSAQMLVRFRADVVALRPQSVHILAGTNDVAGNGGPTSPQDFKNNIISMVELAKANGIAVILGSIPPAAAFPWRPEVKPVPIIQALNVWMRDYAASNGLRFIDYYKDLVGPSGELKGELGNDGVHPNRSGYRIMRRLVEQASAEPVR